MTSSPLVYVVDDDPDTCQSLKALFKTVGIDALTYQSADEFLTRAGSANGRPACMLLDVRMPGLGGLGLLELLRKERRHLPVLMVTGHGDINLAVQSMKLGAEDFIEKPYQPQQLLDSVQEVLRRYRKNGGLDISNAEVAARWESLTPREREVFDLVVQGLPNKAVAYDLGISIRTVETHRARIMEKMKARTLAALVLMSVTLQAA